MKPTLICWMCLLVISSSIAQSKKVYLIPGTGADERLFQELLIDDYEIVPIQYLSPQKRESFEHYVQRLAVQIDTTAAFSIIGVSLGGMIAVELNEFLSPETIIIIASAKSKAELPTRYKIFRWLPLHRIIGGRVMKMSTKLGQPMLEPMEEKHEVIFRSMINEKNPYFIKSAVRWIVEWERENFSEKIIHIHGEKDHTLPLKCVRPDYVLQGGHMITLTHALEISKLVNNHLQMVNK